MFALGATSEKLALQIEQLELALEELEGEAELADVRQPTAEPRERPTPIRSLPPHLPSEERRIEPAAGSCTCPDCGGTLRPLSEDSDEMLDVLPVQWRVARTVFENYHLFRFDVGEASYGIRFDDDYMDPPTPHAGNIRVAKLVERGITDFTYTYDFGDDWRHSIVIEDVLPADPTADYPRFVDGERRAPPEDVGGPPGFEQFLDAMAKPRQPEHKSVLQWYGRPFDPNDISPNDIRARMTTLAKRYASGKAGHANKKT